MQIKWDAQKLVGYLYEILCLTRDLSSLRIKWMIVKMFILRANRWDYPLLGEFGLLLEHHSEAERLANRGQARVA